MLNLPVAIDARR